MTEVQRLKNLVKDYQETIETKDIIIENMTFKIATLENNQITYPEHPAWTKIVGNAIAALIIIVFGLGLLKLALLLISTIG